MVEKTARFVERDAGETDAVEASSAVGAAESGGFSRRSLLLGGAVAAVGAGAAIGGDALLRGRDADARKQALQDAEHLHGDAVIPFYGKHQAGIEMAPQAHQNLVSLKLLDGVARDDIRRMLVILTSDAARLTQGTYALADSEPELAVRPARLTVTFGFGAELVRRVDARKMPAWLHDLPPLRRDKLQPEWNGGDLMLQIASDDRVTVAHATRMLLKDARAFAKVAWLQQGFRRAYGSQRQGQTQRNLLGQLDGTVNMQPGSEDFSRVVWETPRSSGGNEYPPNPAWLQGGTGFAVRRVEFLLDKWDKLDRDGREQAIGRRIDTGAPLTGTHEHDEPDFNAKNKLGFPVIAEFAHIRRARSDNPAERIFRRGYNYDLEPTGDKVSNSGLIFSGYQNSVSAQFTPLLQRLDELDLLNEWIVHIGSAVFAIPPGCQNGEFIGQTLFGA